VEKKRVWGGGEAEGVRGGRKSGTKGASRGGGRRRGRALANLEGGGGAPLMARGSGVGKAGGEDHRKKKKDYNSGKGGRAEEKEVKRDATRQGLGLYYPD